MSASNIGRIAKILPLRNGPFNWALSTTFLIFTNLLSQDLTRSALVTAM